LKKIGILGGSFDPVHWGHLLLAETCREQCGLDEIWFLPASTPPHKLRQQLSSAAHRVAMLQLAIAGHAALRVSTLEIDRGGVSYTVQTLGELTQRYPQDEFYFLMGADSLQDLPTWYQPQEICRLAIPVVVRRAGAPEPDLDVLQAVTTPERLASIRAHQAQMPLIELSSTAIRQAVAAGRSIRYQTPRAVEKYIQTQRLYRTAESP
jgi:nicotinate-nucleotide adenylyltransferase